tara:strand:+ start:723 stop:917 length:195 start_codon:yes stop_codon:yes gene_type:complete
MIEMMIAYIEDMVRSEEFKKNLVDQINEKINVPILNEKQEEDMIIEPLVEIIATILPVVLKMKK